MWLGCVAERNSNKKSLRWLGGGSHNTGRFLVYGSEVRRHHLLNGLRSVVRDRLSAILAPLEVRNDPVGAQRAVPLAQDVPGVSDGDLVPVDRLHKSVPQSLEIRLAFGHRWHSHWICTPEQQQSPVS